MSGSEPHPHSSHIKRMEGMAKKNPWPGTSFFPYTRTVIYDFKTFAVFQIKKKRKQMLCWREILHSPRVGWNTFDRCPHTVDIQIRFAMRMNTLRPLVLSRLFEWIDRWVYDTLDYHIFWSPREDCRHHICDIEVWLTRQRMDLTFLTKKGKNTVKWVKNPSAQISPILYCICGYMIFYILINWKGGGLDRCGDQQKSIYEIYKTASRARERTPRTILDTRGFLNGNFSLWKSEKRIN